MTHKGNETAAHLMILSSDWTWDLYSAIYEKLSKLFIGCQWLLCMITSFFFFLYLHMHAHTYTHTHMRAQVCPNSCLYWSCGNNSHGLIHSTSPSSHYASPSTYFVTFSSRYLAILFTRMLAVLTFTINKQFALVDIG